MLKEVAVLFVRSLKRQPSRQDIGVSNGVHNSYMCENGGTHYFAASNCEGTSSGWKKQDKVQQG